MAIQFALAIAGWGGWNAFFAHPPLRWLAWITAVLIVIAAFSGSSGLSSGIAEDRSNRWVLYVFGAVAFLVPYISALTDRLGFWTLDGETTRWAALPLYVIGGVLRILPVFVLKQRFSGLVAIQADHKLETSGVYGLIRNPSYLGLLLSLLGWVLAFRSGAGVALAALILIPLVARMHAEERLLRKNFGAEYDAYFARTWRLVPWVY